MAIDNEASTVNDKPEQALNAMLQDSDSISKIGSIISKYIGEENPNIPPLSAESSPKENDQTSTLESESSDINNSSPTFQNGISPEILSALPRLISLFSSSKSGISTSEKQQINLLLAIKPYLSEHRRELIDSYIKMSQFSEIFKKLIQGDKNVL